MGIQRQYIEGRRHTQKDLLPNNQETGTGRIEKKDHCRFCRGVEEEMNNQEKNGKFHIIREVIEYNMATKFTCAHF